MHINDAVITNYTDRLSSQISEIFCGHIYLVFCQGMSLCNNIQQQADRIMKILCKLIF